MPSESAIQSNRKIALVLVAISLVALLITGYLGSLAMTLSKVAGCGGGQVFDCDDVINSRWSRWLGIPVSFLAFGVYLAIFGLLSWALLVKGRPIGATTWTLTSILVLAAGLASAWFISLQVLVIKHLCTWCLAAHSCGLISAGVLFWRRPLPLAGLMRNAVVSVAGLGVLIGGQILYKPVTFRLIEHPISTQAQEQGGEVFEFTPPTDQPDSDSTSAEPVSAAVPNLMFGGKSLLATVVNRGPSITVVALFGQLSETRRDALPQSDSGQSLKSQPQSEKQASQQPRRPVTISGGQITLDTYQWPLLGKPDAKFVFVEMYDYTCDHCRRTHVAIREAKRQLGDDLAVVALPVPLNSNCNSAVKVTGPRMAEACEIAKLAVAVWRVDASKFTEFHDRIMASTSTPTYADAKTHANDLLSKKSEELAAELSKPTPGQFIARHVELYKRVGAGNLPKMLFPSTSVVGEFTSPDGLLKIIRDQSFESPQKRLSN